MLKCVIFDMDGTLADTLPLCIGAFRKSIQELSGKDLPDQVIIDTFGPSEEGTVAALLPDQYDEGVTSYLEYYEKLHEKLCPGIFPGIPELFQFLRQRGIKTALVTGKGKKSLDISIRILEMEGWFDSIGTGSPKGPNKPENIKKVLESLQIAPDESIYVGDAPSDIDSSRKAGIPVISAVWAASADEDAVREKKPDQICRTVEEIKEYLEKLIEE